jgi:putative oxidoreductase
MPSVRVVARPMLASMFVVGGLRAFRETEAQAIRAKPVTDRLVPMLRRAAPGVSVPSDPATWVRINGAVQLAGAGMLATGRLPRLAAAVLAAGLGPTTVADHAFWKEPDPQARKTQRAHFVKNVSLAGGLLIAALDRKRPRTTPDAD